MNPIQTSYASGMSPQLQGMTMATGAPSNKMMMLQNPEALLGQGGGGMSQGLLAGILNAVVQVIGFLTNLIERLAGGGSATPLAGGPLGQATEAAKNSSGGSFLSTVGDLFSGLFKSDGSSGSKGGGIWDTISGWFGGGSQASASGGGATSSGGGASNSSSGGGWLSAIGSFIGSLF